MRGRTYAPLVGKIGQHFATFQAKEWLSQMNLAIAHAVVVDYWQVRRSSPSTSDASIEPWVLALPSELIQEDVVAGMDYVPARQAA